MPALIYHPARAADYRSGMLRRVHGKRFSDRVAERSPVLREGSQPRRYSVSVLR
jgi:hypothetical protein